MRMLLLICFLTSSLVQAQSEYSIRLADRLYETGNYAAAIKEYQRFVFYTGSTEATVFLKTGNAYSQLGQWEQAVKYYDRCYHSTSNDSLKLHVGLSKASALIGHEQFLDARVELLQLPEKMSYESEQARNFLMALSLFGLNNFEKSAVYFKAIVPNDENAAQQIDALLIDNKKPDKPNPKFAEIISYVIPGSGQVYAGQYKDGVNSLLLTGSLMTWAVLVAVRYTALDAIITVLPWYQRYLFGGAENAYEFAEQKRNRHRDEVYRQILNIITEAES